jgi:hypothetical protein
VVESIGGGLAGVLGEEDHAAGCAGFALDKLFALNELFTLNKLLALE